MDIVFVSNYMTIHQKPFCDAMIKLIGSENFHFIACEEIEDYRRKQTGFEDLNNEPCVIRAYESTKCKRWAQRLLICADVAIVTIGYSDWLDLRFRYSEGVSFIYMERLLKIGQWYRYFLYPKYLQAWNNALRFRDDSRFHVLCASAFGSADLQLFRPSFPVEKCWKWGYFPSQSGINETHLESECSNSEDAHESPRISLLWVGRMIGWKRPLLPVQLALYLKERGYDYRLTMIGGGGLAHTVAERIVDYGLEHHVQVLGTVPNEAVRQYMRESQALLVTSNRREGWGAVLNEGMDEGCLPIAGSMVGSVPYLVQHRKNGLVFADGNERLLIEQVEWLLGHCSEWDEMRRQAQRTIKEEWNAANAASRLLALASGMLNTDGRAVFASGPCSLAESIPDNWYINKDSELP